MPADDVIYWNYDEMRASVGISSIAQRMSVADSNVVMWINPAFAVKGQTSFLAENGIMVYAATDFFSTSSTVNDYPAIYPNVKYVNVGQNGISSADLDFDKFRRKVGGGEYSTMLNHHSGRRSRSVGSYGPVKVKRMSNQNTHPMHSFSEDYRNMMMAMLSKKMTVNMSYTIGPPVGEVVTFVAVSPSSSNTQFDAYSPEVSGRYLVKSKRITWSRNSAMRTYSSAMELVGYGDGLPVGYVSTLNTALYKVVGHA